MGSMSSLCATPFYACKTVLFPMMLRIWWALLIMSGLSVLETSRWFSNTLEISRALSSTFSEFTTKRANFCFTENSETILVLFLFKRCFTGVPLTGWQGSGSLGKVK